LRTRTIAIDEVEQHLSSAAALVGAPDQALGDYDLEQQFSFCDSPSPAAATGRLSVCDTRSGWKTLSIEQQQQQ
jgi:hypothetical protein